MIKRSETRVGGTKRACFLTKSQSRFGFQIKATTIPDILPIEFARFLMQLTGRDELVVGIEQKHICRASLDQLDEFVRSRVTDVIIKK